MKFTFPPETRVLDGYTIKRAIHRGGFGEVYYALSDAGREVALKLLQNNSEVELRGVQQCLNLSHPNLVTIFDVKQDKDGDHWIIMEYVGGETLDQAVRRHPDGMPMEVIRRWLHGIATGVGFLHSRGLVHRDLKPANVFSEEGIIKVGDVGLSKFITPSRRSAQTQSVGTVYYMAPEVAKGRYGKEVDTYALGIMLYEMLTGHVPFDGESTGEILMKHLTEAPNLAPLPPRMKPIVAKALEKEPAKRYGTIEEFVQAFDAAVLGKPLEIPPELFVQPVVRDVRPLDVRLADAVVAVGQTINPGAALGSPALLTRRVPREPGHVPTFGQRLLPTRGGWAVISIAGFVGLIAAASSYGNPQDGIAGVIAGAIVAYLLTTLPRLVQPLVSDSPCDLDPAEVVALAQADRSPPARVAPAVPPYLSLARVPYSRRARFAQWSVASALATVIVAGLTSGVAVMSPSLLSVNGGQSVSPEAVAFFSLTSLSAAWLLVGSVKWMETDRRLSAEGGESGLRRFVQFAAGASTGAIAWGLQDFLAIDAGAMYSGSSLDGLVTTLGERSLIDGPSSQPFPTLLGYMLFFGGLFGLRAWWRQVELARGTRFRAMSVLLTILVAWLWSSVFAFPQTWAMLWAATISATVQLAAPWGLGSQRGRPTRHSAALAGR